jgi:hypothetical protein
MESFIMIIGKWGWIHHEGETLRSIGILPDGTLWNPNGYREELVRAAIAAASARVHERRSQAAKKAAETRARRRERHVLTAARRLVVEQNIGPREHCYVCGRGLADPESITRGIGSECWQDVLKLIAILRAKAEAVS